MKIDLRFTAKAQELWERIVRSGPTGDEMAVFWIAEALQEAYNGGFNEGFDSKSGGDYYVGID